MNGRAVRGITLPLPVGMVTFLLTDVEGSTGLWEQHSEQMRAALVRHDRLIEGIVSDHAGVVVRPRGEGDSRFAVFADAAGAVRAALAIQSAFEHERWPTPEPLRIRMGIHTGETDLREGDYYGTTVNRCARLRAIGYGGQVLLSGVTARLVERDLPPDASLRRLGQHQLRLVPEPVEVFQLIHPELPASFPPLNTGERSAMDERAHSVMLQKVRLDWIRGVLEPSTRTLEHVEVRLRARPDLVAPPFAELLHHPLREPELVPQGTRIEELFDAANGALVIVGAPGSGKTTLLLQLTERLLDRANGDPRQPVPTVFVLSSWVRRRRPLEEWLVDELVEHYFVPRALARAWVREEYILPLLDSFDEVAPGQRNACAEAISTYYGRHGLQPLVVCSRTSDYAALSSPIRLAQAVELLPLTDDQAQYVVAGNVRNDSELRELMHTPLMLSIAASAQRGAVQRVADSDAAQDPRERILQSYVDVMLERRGSRRFSREQTMYWLGFLARAMIAANDGIFHLDRIQPGWTGSTRAERLVRLAAACVSGLCMGLLILLSGLFILPGAPLSETLVWGLAYAVIGGLLGYSRDIQPVETLRWTFRGSDPSISLGRAARQLLREMLNMRNRWLRLPLILGVAVGVIGGAFDSLTNPQTDPISRGSNGVQQVMLAVIVGWLAFGLYRGLSAGEIGFVRGALLGGAAGVLAGQLVAQLLFLPPLLVALLYEALGQGQGRVPLESMWGAWLAASFAGSLTYALPVCIVSGVLSGLARGELIVRTSPTEGIRRSARSAVIAMLVVGCLVALVTWLLATMSSPLTRPEGLTWAGVLVESITLGMFVALLYGGRACVQHFVLRAVLWRAGVMPWNYSRFLDYATERILLRRVGGGYIFVHRVLLEHFASLTRSG